MRNVRGSKLITIKWGFFCTPTFLFLQNIIFRNSISFFFVRLEWQVYVYKFLVFDTKTTSSLKCKLKKKLYIFGPDLDVWKLFFQTKTKKKVDAYLSNQKKQNKKHMEKNINFDFSFEYRRKFLFSALKKLQLRTVGSSKHEFTVGNIHSAEFWKIKKNLMFFSFVSDAFTSVVVQCIVNWIIGTCYSGITGNWHFRKFGKFCFDVVLRSVQHIWEILQFFQWVPLSHLSVKKIGEGV